MITKTIFLLAAILSVASAFNSKVASMATVSVLDAHTARPSSRSHSTGLYGSRERSPLSPSSLSRTRRQHTSTRTRLQFSDNASSNTTIESSWWRKLFMSPSITSSSTDASLSESEEQENVDAYLEFLDRRYRRLHSDDEIEEKQQASLVSKKGKPFSAMEWLTSGGNTKANIETTTGEQQADALYVLGVAGLASQKLLQKHHLLKGVTARDGSSNATPSPTMDKVVESKEGMDDAIEVDDTKSLKTKMNHAVVHNVLLPIIRVIYLVQRRKQLFLKMVQRQVTLVATKATDGLVNTLAQGPKSILNTFLSIGGGKQNILRTMAIGYATVVVFRPLLRLVFAEGLAFDQLIQ